MGQCIGYGRYKGKCTNVTDANVSLIFCERCVKLRKADTHKCLEKDAPKRERKLLKGRE